MSVHAEGVVREEILLDNLCRRKFSQGGKMSECSYLPLCTRRVPEAML